MADQELNELTNEETSVSDADLMYGEDASDSWAGFKITWANIKATLKTYFDTLYATASTKLDDFGTPDDNTDLDATGSAHGLMPKADKTKLDGIESSADVTDAENIASSINGASGKTTPVDADSVGLIDSADSNALKKLTWSNIKATLKTYLDTLYVALSGNQTIAGTKTFSGDIVVASVTVDKTAVLDVSDYDVLTDETTTAGYYYVGRAPSGSSQAGALWRIAKIADDGSDVEWADGDRDFNNIWNNRASLSYS